MPFLKRFDWSVIILKNETNWKVESCATKGERFSIQPVKHQGKFKSCIKITVLYKKNYNVLLSGKAGNKIISIFIVKYIKHPENNL